MSQIQIDQVGLAAGTPGVSRTDGLDTGALVTLTNDAPSGTTAFRLMWGPPDDTTAEASLAPSSADVWTFSPTPSVYGSYIIELLEDGLVVDRRVFGIRTPSKGLLIPGFNEAASKLASWVNEGSDQIRLSQNNAVDYGDAALDALPYAGWWRSQHELYLAVESGIGATGATGADGATGATGATGLEGPAGGTATIVERFVSGNLSVSGTNTNANVGALGWNTIAAGTGGSVAKRTSEAGHEGIVRNASTAGSSSYSVYLGAAGAPDALGVIHLDDVDYLEFELRAPTTGAVGAGAFFGFSNSISGPSGTEGIYFTIGIGAFVNWRTVTKLASIDEVQTGSVANDGAFHVLRITRVSATEYDFSVDGVVITTHSNPARIPVNSMAVFVQSQNGFLVDVDTVTIQPIGAGSGGGSGATGATGATGPVGAMGPPGLDGADGLDGGPGPAGVAGPAGAQGATGATGDAGAAGATGATGSAGTPGPAGVDGVDGLDGAMGPPGTIGPAGAQGTAGATGATGATGDAGAAGATGATGSAGPMGTPGPAGVDGVDGLDGAMGPPGTIGPAGAQGTAGATGATGATGDAGAAGATGATGSAGTPGPAGVDGVDGLDGAMGPPGTIGPAGAQGTAGATGATGATGDAGAAGATGATGSAGPMGTPGPAGVDGVDGLDGAMGPPGTIGPAGAQGTAGATGATGATGDAGAAGATGATGSAGPMGTPGPAGVDGVDGLDGAMGPPGTIGPAGAQGTAGATGATGATGDAGAAGATGATGSAGRPGTDGLDGAPGDMGPPGARGPAGAIGADGATGATGATGTLAAIAANSILANATAGSAIPAALAIATNAIVARVSGNIVSHPLSSLAGTGMFYTAGTGALSVFVDENSDLTYSSAGVIQWRKQSARLSWWDDFDHCNVTSTSVSTSGGEFHSQVGWYAQAVGSAGSLTPQLAVSDHAGIWRITTAAAISAEMYLYRGVGGSLASTIGVIRAEDINYMEFVVRIPDVTSIAVLVGWAESSAFSNFIFVEYDSTQGFIRLRTAEASATTTDATAITWSNNQWNTLQMVQETAGSIDLLVDDVLSATVATNVPDAEAGGIVCRVFARAASARSLDVDFVSLHSNPFGRA